MFYYNWVIPGDIFRPLNDTRSHTFYSESREAHIRLQLFYNVIILLNILIITKNFIKFQVLM